MLFVCLPRLALGKSLINEKVGEVYYCACGHECKGRGYEGSGNNDDGDGEEETKFVLGSPDCYYFDGCEVEEQVFECIFGGRLLSILVMLVINFLILFVNPEESDIVLDGQLES